MALVSFVGNLYTESSSLATDVCEKRSHTELWLTGYGFSWRWWGVLELGSGNGPKENEFRCRTVQLLGGWNDDGYSLCLLPQKGGGSPGCRPTSICVLAGNLYVQVLKGLSTWLWLQSQGDLDCSEKGKDRWQKRRKKKRRKERREVFAWIKPSSLMHCSHSFLEIL